MKSHSHAFLSPRDMIGFALLAAVLFVVFPLLLEPFRLNLFGKYLTYAFVAVGLVFCWGVGGILSLGQGVYFAIITQAIAAILTILIIGQQGFTGGVNGITDLRTLHGWDIRTDAAKTTLYFVNGVLLFAVLLAAQFVRRSKLGRLLIAMRDQEDRVRFSGYDVANFKIFVFCLGAAFAAIGGTS